MGKQNKIKVDTPYKNSWADLMKRGKIKFDKPEKHVTFSLMPEIGRFRK